jgi:uncharacterized membrane protein
MVDTTEAPPASRRPLPARPHAVRRSPIATVTEDGRALWSVAGLTLVLWAVRLFGYLDQYPVLSIAVVVLGGWGLTTAAVVWKQWEVSRALTRSLAWATLALNGVAIALWSGVQVLLAPQYGTDELAFDQYAAQFVQHGLDPYTHSMANAFQLFNVSPDGYTFLSNGHAVTSLSYPALSFLLYVPFLLVGWSTQLAVAVNVAAWLLSITIAFALLPRRLRPLAIVVGSFGVYVGYAVGGVTDALFLPFLVGAVYRWDRFGADRGWRSWRGPVLLGLAMAVKQTPWLVLPFLLAGVVLEQRRRDSTAAGLRAGSRYLAAALGVFTVPNLAFIVWTPHAWLSDVLTPIASHTVPAGQGLIGLTLFSGVGGGSLDAYSVVLAVVFVSAWAAYVVTYPSLRGWAVFLPSMILFFSARSLGSYLVTLFPAALIAACSVGGVRTGAGAVQVDQPQPMPSGSSGPHRPERPWLANVRRHRVGYVLGAGAVASSLAVAVALLAPAPLAIEITSVRTTGQLATVVQVDVDVTNTTGQEQTPAFTVAAGGAVTAFWIRAGGPDHLPPYGTARYTLLAPNFFAQPPIASGFQVVAFTQNAVSHTAAYLPSTWHVSLSPDAVNRDVPVGDPITVRARILNAFDQPVRRAGEPVYLGQIIYSQPGLQFSEAVINHGNIGETPIAAYTDSEGEATFTIRGTAASTNPVYFEANLVNAQQRYPYGYSQILPIRFGSRP